MAVILNVITGLGTGGAEAVLHRLLTEDAENSHHVISLMNHGTTAKLLIDAGIPVHVLDMPAGKLTWAGMRRLYRLVRNIRPDVIQTWMYHADLVGGIVGRLAGGAPVLWGIHNAYLDPRATGLATRSVARACALLSGVVPQRIISCSAVGARLHVERGYAQDKMRVIPYGYDTSRFKPDSSARATLRREWGVPEDCFLLGMVARWDPQKDHANLIAALAEVKAQSQANWRCALIGTGMSTDHAALAELLDQYDVRDRVILVGPRPDIPAVMSALDLHVLSSMGEAFPNVVAEAMACGTPCVVTDVGDASFIVGNTGWVVPSKNPTLLAAAILQASELLHDPGERERRKAAARARIVDEFSISRMVEAYHQVWGEAIASRSKKARSAQGID